MKTVRLDLQWVEPKIGDYPFSPFAQVVTKNGDAHLTSQCMTPGELDEAINLLKAELEQIRIEGRKRLLKWRPPARNSN